MNCWQVALLPQTSVAVHVRLTTVVIGQGPPITLSVNVTVGIGSQLSVALALPVALGAVESLQARVISDGHTMAGGVASTTLIVCTQLALIPWQPVAVQVRLITVICGQLPGSVLSLNVSTGAGWQLAVVVGLPVALGSVELPHGTVISGGQVMLMVVGGGTLRASTLRVICCAAALSRDGRKLGALKSSNAQFQYIEPVAKTMAPLPAV
jgi:hypothetical protein